MVAERGGVGRGRSPKVGDLITNPRDHFAELFSSNKVYVEQARALLKDAMIDKLKAAAKERQREGGQKGAAVAGRGRNRVRAKSPEAKAAPKVTEQIAKGAKVADSRRPPSAEAPGGRHTPVGRLALFANRPGSMHPPTSVRQPLSSPMRPVGHTLPESQRR
jgi:hypothetical protein